MNIRSTSLILFCVALMLLFLSACQSQTAVESTESVDPATIVATTEAIQAEPTKASPTPTSAPTNTPEALATETPLTVVEPTAVATDEPTATPTAEPTTAPTDVPTVTPQPSTEPGILRTYEIVPDRSEVRFHIDEILLGNPKTVIGRTNEVTGQIVLDLQNPQAVEVGPIQVNAREIVTDDSFRNRALRRQILDSADDEFQFITFTPTAIDGLTAEEVVFGEAQTFNLTGDLQIRDIVLPVTFMMEVTAVNDSELNGIGEVVVLRTDYDLQIPSVPGVANVSDEVKLEIEFVAESGDN